MPPHFACGAQGALTKWHLLCSRTSLSFPNPPRVLYTPGSCSCLRSPSLRLQLAMSSRRPKSARHRGPRMAGIAATKQPPRASLRSTLRTHTVLAPRCARERPLRAQVSSCSHPWLRRLAGGLQTPISRPPSLPTGASLGSDSRPLTSLSSSTRPRTPHGPAPTRSFGVAAMTATRIARSAATRWRNA